MIMKIKIAAILFLMVFVSMGVGHALEDQASLGTQAGEAARDLTSTAGETLATGAAKMAESSQKVETEVRNTLTTLREQWDVFYKQLQEKTQQAQKQLEQQWQDFQKSFSKTS